MAERATATLTVALLLALLSVTFHLQAQAADAREPAAGAVAPAAAEEEYVVMEPRPEQRLAAAAADELGDGVRAEAFCERCTCCLRNGTSSQACRVTNCCFRKICGVTNPQSSYCMAPTVSCGCNGCDSRPSPSSGKK